MPKLDPLSSIVLALCGAYFSWALWMFYEVTR